MNRQYTGFVITDNERSQFLNLGDNRDDDTLTVGNWINGATMFRSERTAEVSLSQIKKAHGEDKWWKHFLDTAHVEPFTATIGVIEK